MELDKTTIVLRQRPLLDLIDLSLVVCRVYWKPLLLYATIGVLPFLLINFFILRPISDYDSLIVFDNQLLEETPLRIRYLLFHAGLVFIESPIAMLGITYFLGQVLFIKQPSLDEMWRSIAKVAWGLIAILGLLRLGVLAFLLVAFVPGDFNFYPELEIFWYGFVLCGTVFAVRAVRPFAPEILLLEQSPILTRKSSNSGQTISYGHRSRLLHFQLSGDLVGRMIAICFAFLMTLTAVALSQLFISGIFFGVWTWEWWMDTIVFPLDLWAIALWGTVFRFLSYLDCRTRLEGWELQLRLRAEARRLTGASKDD